jgi:cysteinyl-tRNA synthetase
MRRLEAATKGWQRVAGAVTLLRQQMRHAPAGEATAEILQLTAETTAAFEEKMNDDFNAPAALAVLQEYTRAVNTLLNNGTPQTVGSLQALEQVYNRLGNDVLGIIPAHAEESGSAEREKGLMELLITLRAQARQNKDWATADRFSGDW